MKATLASQAVEDYVAALPHPDQRIEFRTTVARLQQLSETATDLGEFLTGFVTSVADLYAANVAAIWFLTGAGQMLQRKVDIGWSQLALDASTEAAHADLLAFAIHGGRALAAPPFSAPVAGCGVSNPSDSCLLLAPVRFDQQQVAVLEIGLGPKPLRRPHQVLLASYLEWLEWLSELLASGMQRCFAGVDPVLSRTLQALQETTRAVEDIQNQIRQRIELSVRAFAGQNFGSLAANQTVAKRVHTLLDSKGLRVKCPECGAAAILRCQNARNSKSGAYVFDHYLDSGRTFHGGQTTFPLLTVVPKPPRRPPRG